MTIDWRINRILYKLPNRPYAKTAKDNRIARLVDLNLLIEDINEILEDIENTVGGGGGPVCDITMTPQTPAVLGAIVPFTNLNNTETVDPVIPGVLEITRGQSGGGIYNTILEFGYNNGVSPADTEWNSLYVDPVNNGHGDLTTLTTRTYTNWVEALDFQAGNTIVGLPMVMHVISTDQYFLVTFNQWSSGGSGGGFEYTRQEVISLPSELCRLTFSDGTFLDTVPQPPIDINTWDVRDTAFVDPFNGTAAGVVGDGNKPFQSVAQANASTANHITLLPGNHGYVTLVSKTYFAYPGVEIARLDDGGQAIDARFLGYAEFGFYSFGIQLSGASNLYIECDQFSESRSIVNLTNSTVSANVHLKCDRIFANCNNGAAYACAVRGGGSIVIEANHCYTNHWLVACSSNSTGNTNSFTLRCPDVKILNGGPYGNIGKSLVNNQGAGSAGPNVHIEIDLMGGVYTNEHAVQTTSFGATDSALLLYVNNISANHEMIFKNGTVNAGVFYGLCHHYVVTAGTITLDKIKMFSNTQAIRTYLSNYAGNGSRVKHNYVDCHFESANNNIIGTSQESDFLRCTFKVTDPAELGIILHNNGNPTTQGIAYFKDVYAELVNAGNGEFIRSAVVGILYGMLNTYCTEDLGVNVTDTWAGYTEVPTLKV